MTPWTGDQPDAIPISTQDNTKKKYRQTSTPRVRFEPTIPLLERAKIFYALHPVVTTTNFSSIIENIVKFGTATNDR
jgi:hypothetical protein